MRGRILFAGALILCSALSANAQTSKRALKPEDFARFKNVGDPQLSPDGNWVYAIGDFGGPSGVSLVHLPDLGVRGRWLPDASLNSVWVSADGRTIYLLENGDHLRVIRTDGSQVAKVTLPANTFGFIVPTIP